MRTKKLNLMIIGLIILASLVILGCSNNKTDSKASKKISPNTEATKMSSAAMKGRGPTRDSCPSLKVDLQKYYQSGLKEQGVNDFSTENLIKLLNGENSTARLFSAWLLGARKEILAIPALEKTLNDESLVVQRAATIALLQMGNRKGIPVLQAYVERVAREMEDGNYENQMDQLDALRILADANEISAIPHLKKLTNAQGEDHWATRLIAMRSLAKLHEKDSSVLADIVPMQNDEHSQVRKEADEIVKRIEEKKKPTEPNE